MRKALPVLLAALCTAGICWLSYLLTGCDASGPAPTASTEQARELSDQPNCCACQSFRAADSTYIIANCPPLFPNVRRLVFQSEGCHPLYPTYHYSQWNDQYFINGQWSSAGFPQVNRQPNFSAKCGGLCPAPSGWSISSYVCF